MCTHTHAYAYSVTIYIDTIRCLIFTDSPAQAHPVASCMYNSTQYTGISGKYWLTRVPDVNNILSQLNQSYKVFSPIQVNLFSFSNSLESKRNDG